MTTDGFGKTAFLRKAKFKVRVRQKILVVRLPESRDLTPAQNHVILLQLRHKIIRSAKTDQQNISQELLYCASRRKSTLTLAKSVRTLLQVKCDKTRQNKRYKGYKGTLHAA